MLCRCMWGRRFRLPTLYVYAQTAPALASGYFEETYLFVTWRLAGPCRKVGSPRGWQAETPAPRLGGRLLRRIAKWTRLRFGPVWLKDTRVAQVVADALRHGESERCFYQLRAWVIMPNHVHVLLLPKTDLSTITRWVKGSTARQANLILNRTGEPFWQDESFDHRVRNDFELGRIVRYVECNPVSAGLVANPGSWAWSSARLAGGNACPT